MLTLALIIAFFLACAGILAIGTVSWWLAGLLAKQDKAWRAIWFMLIFAALALLTFAALGWLVANDPVLKTIRMEI
jgi:hypothetical protein